MVFAYGLFALGVAIGAAALWAPGLPDVARLIMLVVFTALGVAPYAIRCPRCGERIMQNGTLGVLAWQRLPGRKCVGCGRDRLWVWPLQDRLASERDQGPRPGGPG